MCLAFGVCSSEVSLSDRLVMYDLEPQLTHGRDIIPDVLLFFLCNKSGEPKRTDPSSEAALSAQFLLFEYWR